MSKILLLVGMIIGGAFVPQPLQAQSITALYRVSKIQHVYKLNDSECVEKKDKKCQKSLQWRVYFQAVSRHVSPKKHQILLDENPPQVGAVIQLTIDL
jgi:chaperone required for assembly of F1-ATPase